ncbi:pirin family protein [Orenia marismortui]|uniref:pirin family protein n=1 Tax=Orenia marismortui TaxID=46469 RepID=UPI0003717D23|nr:pirin family protein [Orenia marismortui]
MIKVIPSNKRYTIKRDWIECKLGFPFPKDKDNDQGFGALKAFNDDIIKAGEGFDMHPHSNMEIVSYVIQGRLGHEDSLGNVGVVNTGGVQRITAGSGVEHTEYNYSEDEEVHFLQLWFESKDKNIKPNWEEKDFGKDAQLNNLLPIISGNNREGTLSINQDVDIYLANLESNKELSYTLKDNHKVYLFVIKGSLDLNDNYDLAKGDSVQIKDSSQINLTTKYSAEIILIDMI